VSFNPVGKLPATRKPVPDIVIDTNESTATWGGLIKSNKPYDIIALYYMDKAPVVASIEFTKVTVTYADGTTDPGTAQAVSTLGGTVIEAEPFASPTNQWAPSAPTQPAWTPPAQQAAPAGNAPACDHGQPMKLIPAGVSKSTGNPFRAFYACAAPREVQCKKRISV
jgi:hypothetical protein